MLSFKDKNIESNYDNNNNDNNNCIIIYKKNYIYLYK